MPHLQRGPSARMGRSVGLLCRKPRRLRWQPGRENALQAGGEEMQELWHLSRTHCGCQQTNLGYLHQWKDEFSRGQVRVETLGFFLLQCHFSTRCSQVRPMITKIVNLMTVPLIQVRLTRIVILNLITGNSPLCLQDGRKQGGAQR